MKADESVQMPMWVMPKENHTCGKYRSDPLWHITYDYFSKYCSCS